MDKSTNFLELVDVLVDKLQLTSTVIYNVAFLHIITNYLHGMITCKLFTQYVMCKPKLYAM